MKLLSATLLGVLTSGIIASEVYDGAFYLDLDGRRRPRPPKGCKGPKCSTGGRPTVAPKKTLRPTRPSKKAPPKKAPKGPKKPPTSLFGNKPSGKKPSGKKPVIQQQVQTERPGRPKKSPPAKKAPPRPKKGTKAPVTKAPTKAPKGKNGKPCRGKWCRKPCWPNCETHRPKPEVQAPQFKIDASDGDTGGRLSAVFEDHHEHDEVYYPKNMLKFMADNGQDVSGLKAIPGRIDMPQEIGAGKGLVNHSKWNVRDPVDNKIVVPFSFMTGYPASYRQAAIDATTQMNEDLGCLKTVFVPEEELATTSFTNGIFIAWQDFTGGGCYSALGKAPGFIGNSPANNIGELGGPPAWQLMSYGDMSGSSCRGDSHSTIMHEFMHAMGVKHEHARPDREEWLNVDLDQTEMDSQFTLIADLNWIQIVDGNGAGLYPYETASVMHYCSMCGSSTGQPVMTYKDGSIFDSGAFMTTTDSLQLIWSYCNDDADQGNPKDTIQCGSDDNLNVNRPVYLDRLCDNRRDCHNGEDEAGEAGGLAECIPAEIINDGTVWDGCCGNYFLDGVELVRGNFDFNGSPTYVNPSDSSRAIVRMSNGRWAYSAEGIPSSNSFAIFGGQPADTGSTCPPTDNTLVGWADGGVLAGTPFEITCKMGGFQLFNAVDECAEGTHTCVDEAVCTDTPGSFRCDCPASVPGQTQVVGDGLANGTGCTTIILEDECANGNNNCPSVCTDEVEGFTCSCTSNQVDDSANQDGTSCIDQPCCLRFKIGLNQDNTRMLCEFHSIDEHNMYEYVCNQDPDFPGETQFNFPSSVQWITFFSNYGPQYFLLNGHTIPLEAGTVNLWTNSPAPTGRNCPSMNNADWAPIVSWSDWLVECIEFEAVATQPPPTTLPPADPCQDGTHNCAQGTGVCTTDDNSANGFSCACTDGFTGDGTQCTALVNECETGQANCDPNAFCSDADIGFSCVCNDGFDGNGFNCEQIDVNECADPTQNTCSPNTSQCVNSSGGFACECFAGFENEDAQTCVDIDECADSTTCNQQSQRTQCFNVEGGFDCACLPGFTMDPNSTLESFECLDINECDATNSPCGDNSICDNTDGGFECGCAPGFEMDANNQCVDTDECGSGVCDTIAHDFPNLAGGGCQNFNGGFVCTCEDGYQGGIEVFNGQFFGDGCSDIDECSIQNLDACRVTQGNPVTNCVNTDGSFTCDCASGFQSDNGIDCLDIDECAQDICNIDSQQEPAQCVNFEGGWQCECAVGFIASTDQPLGPFRTESDFHCIDIDECLLDPCGIENGNPANCVNNDGGFECVCQEGTSADSSGACISDNFCADDPCGLQEGNEVTCNHTPNGPECVCNQGYIMNANGWCDDFDECADTTLNVCNTSGNNPSVCANLPGTFECGCESGFLMNDVGECMDIDECGLFRMRVSCSANTNCQNTFGSFECFCNAGFEELETANGVICGDIDECADPTTCHPSAVCTNFPGEWGCSCPEGTSQVAGTSPIECVQDDPCASVECVQGKECQVTAAGDASCVDIDECVVLGADTCPAQNTACFNTNPGFVCDCVQGMVPGPNGLEAGCDDACVFANCGNGFDCFNGQCVDVDECADATLNTCVANSDCQNWQGGFSCICQDGYNPQFHPTTEEVEWCQPTCNVMTCGEGTFCNSDDNGAFCEDLNECMLVESCPAGHQCENINCASEQCQVFGDGFICHEPQVTTIAPPVDCEPGYAPTMGMCMDVNECDFDDACHTFETCVNTEGSFTCEFDPSSCPTNKELRQKFNKNSANSPVVWQKGTTYGKLKFHGEDHSGLQVKVLKSDFVNVRKSNYYAFLAFGRTRCGKKFQQALLNGDVTVDVMDRTDIYTVMDVYEKSDGADSLVSIMINLHDTTTKDLPIKKGAELTSRDDMYVFFNGLENVEWGTKNWKQCVQKLTVGAMQDAEDPFFSHACAIWQKNNAH